MNKQAGVSLIEAMVAAVVVGIGFVAIYGITTSSTRVLLNSIDREKGNMIANMIMEDIVIDVENITQYHNINFSSSPLSQTNSVEKNMRNGKVLQIRCLIKFKADQLSALVAILKNGKIVTIEKLKLLKPQMAVKFIQFQFTFLTEKEEQLIHLKGQSMQSEKGFSLIEMMITLAISAIIIGAAFGSYTIISRNFEWQKDMKYISQSARNVIEMIQKDIRNAGFRFEANAAITDPVKIYDAGDCCDRIEIIYDETINKRVKIEYRLQQYSSDNNRFRLYKKKTNLSNNNTVEFDTPIADYIEALKFTGSRGNCTDGDVKEGCGIEQLVTLPQLDTVTLHGRNNNTCSDDILKIFDGDPNTYWSCTRDSGEHKYRQEIIYSLHSRLSLGQRKSL